MLRSVSEGNVNCGRCDRASWAFARSVSSATVAMTAALLFWVLGLGSFCLGYFPIGERELSDVITRVFGHYCDCRGVVISCIVNVGARMGVSCCWGNIVLVGSGKIVVVIGKAGIQILDKCGTVGASGWWVSDFVGRCGS